MHHHPVSVNSKWIDEMILKDAGHFNKIVQTNKRIKAVLFGHIHQVFEKEINGTFYASAPATCYQVQSNTEKFSIERVSAGYRLIELDGDKFSSKVVWVE
jgi:Icc protein